MRIAVTIFLVVGLAAVETEASPSHDFTAIDEFVSAQMQANRIPGLALAITHHQEIVHLQGFGTAGRNREVTPQTPFLSAL